MKEFSLLALLLIPSVSNATTLKKINTGNYIFRFPSYIKKDAPYFVDHFKKCVPIVGYSLKVKELSGLSIFLGNTSVENACVMTRVFKKPYSSIYYLNANFLLNDDKHDFDYLSVLIHEMRHSAQFFSLFNTFSLSSRLILSNFSIIPQFYYMLMEGDAVLTETLLTKGGRGRNPNFLMEYKVKTLNNKNYKFLDFLYDNRYDTGYVFYSYIRKKYGIENYRQLFLKNNWYQGLEWKKTYKNFKLLLNNIFDFVNPLSISCKISDFSGKDLFEQFEDVQEDLKKKLNYQLSEVKISEFEKLNKKNGNYFSPQLYKDGIIALKTTDITDKTNNELDHYVFLKDCQETWLHEFDSLFLSEYFSCKNNKIVLSNKNLKPSNICFNGEYKKPNNAIYILDGDKRTVEVIDRYPHCGISVLSYNAQKIAFLSPSKDFTPLLVVINVKDGKLLKQYRLKKYHNYKNLRWTYDDKILFVDKFDGCDCIKSIENGKINEIYKSKHLIGEVDENLQYVFFISSYSGINNIYALEKTTKAIFQVTSSEYGVKHFSIVNNSIVYNNFNKNCFYDVAKIDINKNCWIRLEEIKDKNIYLFDGLQTQELGPLSISDLSIKSPEKNKYKIDNVVSWVPSFEININEFLKSRRQKKSSYKDFVLNYVSQICDFLKLDITCLNYEKEISLKTILAASRDRYSFKVGLRYQFLDRHVIGYCPRFYFLKTNKECFYQDSIFLYGIIFNGFIGQRSYSFKPQIRVILKKDWGIDVLLSSNLNLKTFNYSNCTDISYGISNIFLKDDFVYKINRKNKIETIIHFFESSLTALKNNNLILDSYGEKEYKIPPEICKNLLVNELSQKKIKQIGARIGYEYSAKLNCSFNSFTLRQIDLCPRVDVIFPMNNIPVDVYNKYSFIFGIRLHGLLGLGFAIPGVKLDFIELVYSNNKFQCHPCLSISLNNK